MPFQVSRFGNTRHVQHKYFPSKKQTCGYKPTRLFPLGTFLATTHAIFTKSPYWAHLERKFSLKNAHLRLVNSAFSAQICTPPASQSVLYRTRRWVGSYHFWIVC